MTANLSDHARVAGRFGLPQVGRPKPPTPDSTPLPSPAGSLFDGSDDEDALKIDLNNSKAEQTTSSAKSCGAPIPSLEAIFPRPDAALSLGPPSTSSPRATPNQARLQGFGRCPEGVVVLNPHACEHQSVWTSSPEAPNIPQAVQARTDVTSVAQAQAPSQPVLPDSLQHLQPPAHPITPLPTRREDRQPVEPVQDTRHAGDALVPEATMTTLRQSAENTGRWGGHRAADRFEWEWRAPPHPPRHMMVTATVAAHTRSSGIQRPTGSTTSTPNHTPTPTAAPWWVRTQTTPPATGPPPAQAPGPSATIMQETPHRIPHPQLMSDTCIFTPHELSSVAFERRASKPDFATHSPLATHVSLHLPVQSFLATLPLPAISGTTAQPGNSQMSDNKGIPGIPVKETCMQNAGPSGSTHPSTSHYTHYQQPAELTATPPGSQDAQNMSQPSPGTTGFGSNGSLSIASLMQGGSTPIQALTQGRSQAFNEFSATGASISYFSGAYIPPPSMPGSVLCQKRPADTMQILNDGVQGIQLPPQGAKRPKYTHK